MPEVFDIAFEVVFPEIATHVLRFVGVIQVLRRIAPRYGLRRDQSLFKGAGREAEDDSKGEGRYQTRVDRYCEADADADGLCGSVERALSIGWV